MLSIEMKRNAFRVLATLAFAAAPAFASPIFVNNFSFETYPVLDGVGCPSPCAYDTGAIPGWPATAGITTNTISGQIQPGGLAGTIPDALFNTLSDGVTSAYSNGPTLSQQVGATVGVGTVYTLLVDIGQRMDSGSGSYGGSADLLIGATAGNGGAHTTILAAGTAPDLGKWSTFTLMYLGTAADAGATITIELKNSLGVVGNVTHQGNFDNVQLSAVPEPASFLLIGSALLALTAFRRRRPIA